MAEVPIGFWLEDLATFAAVLQRLSLLPAELEAVCMDAYVILALLAAFAYANSAERVSRELCCQTQHPQLTANLDHVNTGRCKTCYHIFITMH